MNQDHYRKLIMSAPVGYAWHKIILDEHGRPCDYLFLDVNPAFELLSGLEASKILNRRITEVLPEITRDDFDWIGKYGEVARNQSEFQGEVYSNIMDKWFRVYAYSPEKMYFSTVFIDVTSMKRMEEEQNLLVDHIQTQIWYLTDWEHYGRVNQAHADFVGFSKDELQHKSLYDFLNRDEADQCFAINKRVFGEKKMITTKEWALNSKGDKRLLRITKNPKCDRNGNVEFVVCTAEDITDKRREKQALRQSEEKFRHIFENSPLGILHIDTSGTITDCNDNFVEIIGSSYEALKGINTLQLPDKKIVEAVRVALNGDLMSYEGDYASTTAVKVTPVRVLFAPVTSDSGSVIGAMGIVEDITKRKKAEQELKISEQKLRSLIEGIDEIIFVLDKNLVIKEFSQPLSRKLLRPKEDFLGKSLDEIEFPEPARSEIKEALMKTWQTGEFNNLEYYLDMPSGRSWFEMNITAASDVEGHRILIGVVRDATKRKQVEEALRENEIKYRQLFDDSPISLWEQDFSEVKRHIDEIKKESIDDFRSYFDDRPDLVRELAAKVKVLNVNKATIRQYNATSREDFFAGIWKVFNESSYTDFVDALVLIAEGGKELTVEKKHSTLDGKVLDIHLHWAVVTGYESTYSRVITSAYDITERKRAEEINRKNLHEKNVLLSEIHHRVKNNMAVISSLLTLQSDFEDHISPDKILRDTRNRVHSMSLVHELVYETKNFAEIKFHHLLHRLAENLDKAYRMDGKDIEVKISAEELLLELNQSVPCTLLVNELLSNAYMHAFENQEKGTIEVRFQKDKEHYRIEVRDDGIGMENPEKLENPESFGYTIIHGLVQQVGGTIRVRSGNRGLTVEVLFKPSAPFNTAPLAGKRNGG